MMKRNGIILTTVAIDNKLIGQHQELTGFAAELDNSSLVGV